LFLLFFLKVNNIICNKEKKQMENKDKDPQTTDDVSVFYQFVTCTSNVIEPYELNPNGVSALISRFKDFVPTVYSNEMVDRTMSFSKMRHE
jgi:hypothetical protein